MPKGKYTRTRNYATIVYPESAPVNFKEILNDSHISCFISPLHDKDISANGEPKKPHYHVMIMFDNVKTKEQAQEVFTSIGGVGCEVVNSIRAYARYLCHLDDYDKAPYSPADVLCFGGSNYLDTIGTMSDKLTCIREMMIYIKEHHVICFADLFDFAADQNDMWFDALTNGCAYIIREYIKSRFWKENKDKNPEENT